MEKLNELVDRYPRYGFPKLFALLKRQGYRWNHKRVHRVYCKMGLNMRRKGKRRFPCRNPQGLRVPERINQSWSIEVMSDRLWDGRKLGMLTIYFRIEISYN
ncbi:hypothetical protein CSB45_06580 [candidate division KSB3 bacterium]|uniref:HTH-like domain-containing protein n=1 Tax=candidate division KSB3 bacterium TaxID=2044937 RepID=A0A2G6E5Y2_9BACT|nr:MAG: hypothetical protein CSB45_06580 [candidate division KSB3 bacterium]